MAVRVFNPVNIVLTTQLQDLGTADTPAAVPVGKERIVTIRAGCAGAGDAVLSGLFLIDTHNAGNVANRAPNLPIPYNSRDSAPDLETEVTIPAGFKFAANAGANGTVHLSMTGRERDVEPDNA
jgi:hypothetical protein